MIFFAQKAFIVDQGRLLLVRKAATSPVHPLKWEVPGGRLHEDESLSASIEREVREETGLIVKPGEVFFVWDWTFPSRNASNVSDRVVAVARFCQIVGGALTDEQRVADDELAELKWVPFKDLSSVDFIPNMEGVMGDFIRRKFL